MQLNYARTNVRDENSIETRAASVQLNSTIAHVFSRDLYTKPVESMFREVLTNALDSHIEARQTRPVEIKVPSAFDELWYIRDYGTGIPHEKFMDLYLDFGNSTRYQSDDYTGAFGLGCKSPLAYKSSFQIRSFYNNVERLYLIYYNEDNIPQVSLRSEKPTFEPNGIEVSLTLNSSHEYFQFQDAANKLLSRIDPARYVLVGENPWFSPFRDTSKFQTYGNVSFYESSSPVIDIVMGVVAYSLDSKEVLKLLDNINCDIELYGQRIRLFSVLTSLLQKYSLEINAGLGEYPIHPSREFINITPRAAKKLANDVTTALEQMALEHVDNFSTDLFLSRLGFSIDRLQGSRLKIRMIRPVSSWYHHFPTIGPVLSTYEAFIQQVKHEKNPLLFAPLSSDLLVNYLGNNRTNFEYPFLEKSDISLAEHTLVFYEKDLCPEFEELIKDSSFIDLSEQARAYAPLKIKDCASNPSYSRTVRTSTPLLKDKKHNVLLIERGDGGYKRCWESAQHNVETLKALGVPVYWVPVHMGCLKDLEHKKLVSLYTNLKQLGIKKYPVVIGLPASKGTKAIEQNFQPIENFSLWVEQHTKTDSFVRRLRLYQTQLFIHSQISYLKPALNYRSAAFLQRIIDTKHVFNMARYIAFIPELASTEPFDVQNIIDDVIVKFPFTIAGQYFLRHVFSEDGKYYEAIQNWALFLNSLNETKN